MSEDRTVKKPGRIDFVDLLRGWAVVVMIETHVVNATLAPEHTSALFFQYLKFLNGLVAPTFLFASGLSYAVTTHRKVAEYLSFGKPLFVQLGRILNILLIGYMLHIPIFSARRLFTEATDEQWQSFFQVDVLQCIAVSLLLLQALLLVLRSEKRQSIAALLVAVVVVVLTPFMWEIDFSKTVPWVLAGYLNGVTYSLFPLFPWLSFLFAGAITGHYFALTREQSPRLNESDDPISPLQTIGWIGGSLILLGFLIGEMLPGMETRADYWVVSPGFFTLRLGLVMILCAGLGLWSHEFPAKGRPLVRLFGKESLLIYVAHLLVLYGTFGSFNLARDVGESLGYFGAGVLTLVLTLLMFGLAAVWNRMKSRSPRWTRIVTVATITVVAISFLFGEG